IHFNHKCQKNEQENILTIREIKNIEEKTGVVERQYQAKEYVNKSNAIYFPVNIFSFESIYFLRNIRMANKEEKL
ncbi:hypothetical protein, partial [Campylobacter coli]